MQHSHSKHCDLKDLRAILASYSNKKLSPPLTMSIVVMTTYSSTWTQLCALELQHSVLWSLNVFTCWFWHPFCRTICVANCSTCNMDPLVKCHIWWLYIVKAFKILNSSMDDYMWILSLLKHLLKCSVLFLFFFIKKIKIIIVCLSLW